MKDRINSETTTFRSILRPRRLALLGIVMFAPGGIVGILSGRGRSHD